MILSRELALLWWDTLKNLPSNDDISKLDYVEIYYPKRNVESLTGREIEHIYYVEKIDEKAGKDWWATLPQSDKNKLTKLFDGIDKGQIYRWVLAIAPIVK